MLRFYFMMLALCLFGKINSQHLVAKEIQQFRTTGHQPDHFELLKFQSDDVHNRSLQLQGLNKGTIMNLDQDKIQSLFEHPNDFITLSLPVSKESSMTLVLKQHQILTNEFAVYTSDDPAHPMPYTPGLFYQGMVEGDANSVVAVSVFPNEIMAMITTDQGNYVLGAIKGNRESNYVFYNDRDLDKRSDFLCGTPDDGLGYTQEQLRQAAQNRDAGDCIRLYVEIDDDVVADKGGAAPATNFITGLYNQCFVLYNNEGITMMLNQMLAWTSNSPYTGSTSSAMLTSYQNSTGTFNGNLSALVSYATSGGIAAGFSGICNSNPDLSKCFCSINSTYANVPTYSWSVMVVTHELGHLIGSRHTHACVWNGNNTAIDGCAGAVEGSCPLPGNPAQGGTMMSYCHLQSCGINFNLGFGTQPGNVIRNTVNAAGNCLTPSGPPPPPPPAPPYCTSSGTNTNYEWIKKVVLGSINNQSGSNSGYGNYTNISANLNASATYTINLTPGHLTTPYSETWRVWIDYNNDHDWADAGEQVAQGSGTAAINVTFSVPAINGTLSTKMRISMQYNAAPPVCGNFTYGEVEDYAVTIIGTPVATCSDGIQNQGETGIDCGGPCTPCPTCHDGIQNQGETGIDCGGPCAVCATCNDGIQNQGETGIDCGGPCSPCTPVASCTDGIQNQGETGVDCGGPCTPCAPQPSCTDGIQNQGETGIDCGGPCNVCAPPPSNVLMASYFETGWDSWIDGGSDADRINTTYSFEGSYSIRLDDNGGVQSSMTSPVFNLSTATGVQFSFHFYAVSMESGEDFWVQYKNGTGNWTTIATYVRGPNFTNNTFYTSTVNVPNFVPTTAGSFRIQCDSGDNTDQIYIDAVTITKLTGTALIEKNIVTEAEEGHVVIADDVSTEKELSVFPNPVRDQLNISINGTIQNVRIYSFDGKEMKEIKWREGESYVNINSLTPGIYFISVQSEGEWYPEKFSKM